MINLCLSEGEGIPLFRYKIHLIHLIYVCAKGREQVDLALKSALLGAGGWIR